jgi:NADP-dependent aldehyde dehydrogenase
MNLSGTSLIGTARATPAAGHDQAINPATGQPLGPVFHHASADDVARATTLAAEAFVSFGRSSGKTRAALLRRIADLIQENTADLVARANLETGLPAARLQGEIGRTTGQLRLFAQVAEDGHWVDARIDHADPGRTPVPKPDVRSMCRPLGPAVVFSSSNFPFAFSVAGGDTASALAAGCPVIVKAHQGHLGTSEMTAMLVQQAVQEQGLPEGTFSLLFGPGRVTGIALVTDPRVKAVGFTGSTAGGRALMDAAAARPDPIPVYAEMGSVNPVFLLPGALDDRAEAIATGLHGSVTLGVGQFCTNPGLVFVPDSPAADAFLGKLAELIVATPAGVMLTPSICSEYAASTGKTTAAAGVDCLARAQAQAGVAAAGHAMLFSTSLATFLANPDLLHEMFGPATLVVRCPDAAVFPAIARRLPGQLTASVHGTAEELAASAPMLDALAAIAGRVVINGYPTGVEVCHAMNHGGPYPATADGRTTSVGTRAIHRFARPVCYQDFPDACLPLELQEANPSGIRRLVDGASI